MYNEELKGKFIKGYTTQITTRQKIKSVFDTTEPFEAACDTDLCAMSEELVKPVLDSLSAMRDKTLSNRIYTIHEYVKWCIKSGVPGACDAALRVTPDTASAMRKQTVRNPLHMQRFLDAICDAEGLETADNIIRCFCWLAYSGMPEADILKVKALDVDMRKMKINFNGTEYPIYRESMECLHNCMELTSFRFIHPNYTESDGIYRERVEGDTLVRGIRSAPSLASIRSKIANKNKDAIDAGKTDVRLSYYRIWISGLFYRAYELELAGIKPDFSDTASSFMAGKTYKLDSGRNTIDAKRRKIASDYYKDYLRWKETLSV